MKDRTTLSLPHDASNEAAPPQFEDILMAHLGALYRTALRLTKDQQQAEDLVQEASLRAWSKRGQLKTSHAGKGWLFKILMNTFINRYRKASREPEIVDIALTEEMLEQTHGRWYGQSPANPQDLLLDQCLAEEIQEALDQLHTEIRSVVWLSDVEGFRHQEIAEMLGCPLGTIASRLFRGRAMLRELLGGYTRAHGMNPDQRGKP